MQQQELHMGPAGLFSDPLSRKAPAGALRTGDNIVIRRDGIVQPRPGFNYAKVLDSNHHTYRAIPFKDDMVLYTSGPHVRWYSNLSEITKEASADLGASVLPENFRGCEARNNLYIPFSDGVRKLTGALDAEASKAGGPRSGSLGIYSVAAGDAVDTGHVVLYRGVLKRTDVNMLVTRGIPTAAMLYDNSSGIAVDPTLEYYLSGEEVAGDIIEIYRSANFNTGTVPDEELGLVLQKTLSSTDITAGFILVTDINAAGDRGATIYTAPSREGPLQENAIPPKCADIALFKNSMFYGNTEGPHRVNLEVMQAADADQTGDATGIGVRIATGDTTNTSDQLTNVAPTTGLQIGQLVYGAGIPTATYVAGISGTTITMTKNATATAVGITVTFRDTLIVGSTTSYVIYYYNGGAVYIIAEYINILRGNYLARQVSNTPSGGYPGTKGVLTLESRSLGDSKWYIWGTHGEAYFPVLTGPTGYDAGLFTGLTTSNGVGSDNEDHANRIIWSKNDQPEHVPEQNNSSVGSENYSILRIIPTRDALFIFKKDGIWRLTGAGVESGWRIDEFDLSTKLLRPDCAVEMGNAIYAWTNKGLVRVTDTGIDFISATAIGDKLRELELSLLSSSSTYREAWITANPKDNEIILSPRIPDVVATTYVFNIKTLAWYTWSFSDYAESLDYIVYNTASHLLYLFDMESVTPKSHIERRADWITDASDRSYAITISAVTGLSITITAGSGWYPARGDAVYSGTGADYIVTSVTDSTHFAVARTGLSIGAATGHKAINCNIEWVAKTAGNEGALKHYAEGGYAFNVFNGIHEVLYSFWSSISTTAVAYYEAFRSLSSYLSSPYNKPRTVRFTVPSAHARVVYLYPKITIRQALSRWELTGISLFYIPLKGRGMSRGDAVPAAQPSE